MKEITLALPDDVAMITFDLLRNTEDKITLGAHTVDVREHTKFTYNGEEWTEE